jgi:hypothetical protein
MSHCVRKDRYSIELNGGPPSDAISSGTPNNENQRNKNVLIVLILLLLNLAVSIHPEYLSAYTMN